MTSTSVNDSPGASLVDGAPRTLGQFTVGPLAFGCWRFITQPVAQATALLEAALDAGMNLVDNADVYGLDWDGTGFGTNEEMLGKVLADQPGLRDRMVLATKGGILPPTPYNSGASYLVKACEDSLARLGVEVIDLYQIHRPDFYTHPEEVASALSDLRSAGKIKEVGVSNHLASQTDALQAYLPFPIVADQPEFSLMATGALRDGTLDRCMQHQRVPLAWSPLAGGRLATGSDVPPELLTVMDELAEREGVSRAVLAVAFVLAHPSKPVAIVGSQQADRLVEQAAAVNVALDRDDVYRMIQAAEGQPLP
ncbi:MAG: aldo/keto reductase [Actinomycetota bacterium]